MARQFYAIFIATSIFANGAYGYNYKLLDSEADTYVCKLCSGTPIKLVSVQESLEDLKTDEDLGEKYSAHKKQLNLVEDDYYVLLGLENKKWRSTQDDIKKAC